MPIIRRGTWPVMATIGTLSRRESAKPLTRLVAPGPEVAIQTPGTPEALAYPSAAKTPPCSWRGRTLRMILERVRAWWISMEAPPGYAKTSVTPSRSRASTRTSLPFRGSSGANLETNGVAVVVGEELGVGVVVVLVTAEEDWRALEIMGV